MVAAVGELEFSDETARSRLLDEAGEDGRRPGISLELVPIIAQKKEFFDGNQVVVTGRLKCELGPDRNADGLPLFGSIVDVKDVRVLRGEPRDAFFEAANLAPASGDSANAMKAFAEEWFTSVKAKNPAGVAGKLGSPDALAELHDSSSRRHWILFGSPRSLTKRLAVNPEFCGVYEYRRPSGSIGHAYCLSDQGCGRVESREGRVASWLGSSAAYCVQIGSSDSGKIWMSDAAAY